MILAALWAEMAKSQHAKGYRPIPDLLRELRVAAGLTQREIGKELGRPQSWVYNNETGNRRVDVSEFVLWCRACGVDPASTLTRFAEKIVK